MDRREFFGATAGVMGVLLGSESLSFARRNVVGGSARASTQVPVTSRASGVAGRVTDVRGTKLSVELASAGTRGSVRLLAVRRGYPDGREGEHGWSDTVDLRPEVSAKSVDLEVPRGPLEPEPWFYEVHLRTVGDDRHRFLCESDPVRWTGRSGREVEEGPRVASPLADVSRERFARERDGNDYRLQFRWRDGEGRRWTLPLRQRRSVHEAAIERTRGYVRTFEESQASKVTAHLAAKIESEATSEAADGPTTADELPAGERFDLLVRFVQALDYVRDSASTGRYDYNRTVEETLVEGRGDCKDKTHLLAGLLSSSTLACDVAMLLQPAHVLLGVADDDVPTPFDSHETVTLGDGEYLPVDPSWRFGFGEYPDAEFTAAYADGEWVHLDVGAVARGVDRYAREVTAATRHAW